MGEPTPPDFTAQPLAQMVPAPACAKCGQGQLTVYQYVNHSGVRAHPHCYRCPPEEHLHISCALCGYTIHQPTADTSPP